MEGTLGEPAGAPAEPAATFAEPDAEMPGMTADEARKLKVEHPLEELAKSWQRTHVSAGFRRVQQAGLTAHVAGCP